MGLDILKSIVAGFLLVLVICAALIGLGGWVGYTFGVQDGYKDGQIDAQNGKVKWHLVTKADSTKAWEENK